MPRAIAALVVVLGTLGALAAPAAAQERPAPAIEFAAGGLFFPDDDGPTVRNGMIGGNGRFYVSPRVSVGPEVAYVPGENYHALMLTGNVTIDLTAPDARVTPFVVGGAGIFRSTQAFVNTPPFSHTEGAFTAGGGVRARLGDHVIVGAEARVGWELHLRANGFVGARLGK